MAGKRVLSTALGLMAGVLLLSSSVAAQHGCGHSGAGHAGNGTQGHEGAHHRASGNTPAGSGMNHEGTGGYSGPGAHGHSYGSLRGWSGTLRQQRYSGSSGSAHEHGGNRGILAPKATVPGSPLSANKPSPKIVTTRPAPGTPPGPVSSRPASAE